MSEYHKEWWLRNKERYREQRAEYERYYQQTFPDRRLLKTAKSRAKLAGLEFDLTIDDVVIPENCPVLNKPMVRGTPYAPSLDRKDPDGGYVKGNVEVMSRLANVMKNNASPEDLRSFAHWVLKTYPNFPNESTDSSIQT